MQKKDNRMEVTLEVVGAKKWINCKFVLRKIVQIWIASNLITLKSSEVLHGSCRGHLWILQRLQCDLLRSSWVLQRSSKLSLNSLIGSLSSLGFLWSSELPLRTFIYKLPLCSPWLLQATIGFLHMFSKLPLGSLVGLLSCL